MGTAMVVAGVVSAVASLAGGVYQYKTSREAASEQERIAEANAQREEMETEEMAQREEIARDREQSLARARAAASGAGMGDESTQLYMEDLRGTRQREIDWIRRSGASRAGITRRMGAAQADATRAAGVSSLIAGIGGAAKSAQSTFGSIKWPKPKPKGSYASYDASADHKSMR